jgi:hypothetical protein
MQIDRELYEIMGDENEKNMVGKGRKNRPVQKQRKTRSPLKYMDLNAKLITNQVSSAQLADQLIDDLKNLDSASDQMIKDLGK